MEESTSNHSSTGPLENLIRKFIDLLDDFKNSEADHQKIDTLRALLSVECSRLIEIDNRRDSQICGTISPILEVLDSTMGWIGNKERKRQGERSQTIKEEIKNELCEQSENFLFQVSDNEAEDFVSIEHYEERTAADRENVNTKKKRRRRKKDSPNEFPCQECEKRFVSKKQMQNHSRVHSAKEALDSGRFKCEFCGKCFRTKQNLSVHKKTHLENEAARKHNQCNICGNHFTQSSHLKEHKRIHMEDESARKPHACDTCGKRFTQSSHLREHKKTHLQDENARKPHVCYICERRFSQAAHLRKHKTIHLGQL